MSSRHGFPTPRAVLSVTADSSDAPAALSPPVDKSVTTVMGSASRAAAEGGGSIHYGRVAVPIHKPLDGVQDGESTAAESRPPEVFRQAEPISPESASDSARASDSPDVSTPTARRSAPSGSITAAASTSQPTSGSYSDSPGRPSQDAPATSPQSSSSEPMPSISSPVSSVSFGETIGRALELAGLHGPEFRNAAAIGFAVGAAAASAASSTAPRKKQTAKQTARTLQRTPLVQGDGATAACIDGNHERCVSTSCGCECHVVDRSLLRGRR